MTINVTRPSHGSIKNIKDGDLPNSLVGRKKNAYWYFLCRYVLSSNPDVVNFAFHHFVSGLNKYQLGTGVDLIDLIRLSVLFILSTFRRHVGNIKKRAVGIESSSMHRNFVPRAGPHRNS